MPQSKDIVGGCHQEGCHVLRSRWTVTNAGRCCLQVRWCEHPCTLLEPTDVHSIDDMQRRQIIRSPALSTLLSYGIRRRKCYAEVRPIWSVKKTTTGTTTITETTKESNDDNNDRQQQDHFFNEAPQNTHPNLRKGGHPSSRGKQCKVHVPHRGSDLIVSQGRQQTLSPEPHIFFNLGQVPREPPVRDFGGAFHHPRPVLGHPSASLRPVRLLLIFPVGNKKQTGVDPCSQSML